jgi:hypothetical protein
MKRLLPVLCLFAMWVAPAHGETFRGFNQGPAYNLGWNLSWAGSCLVSGTIDTISKLQIRAEEVFKGKELSLYEKASNDGIAYQVSNCSKERIEKLITYTKRILDSREKASKNYKTYTTVTCQEITNKGEQFASLS